MAMPERELNPDLSAAHRFGYELRRLRKDRSFSQNRLAATVHVSGDLIQKVETAQRKPQADFAERCDHALNAAGLLVRLWEAVEHEHRAVSSKPTHSDKNGVGIPDASSLLIHEPSMPTSSEAGGDVTVSVRTSDGGIMFVAVPRRKFLQGVSAGTLELVLANSTAPTDVVPELPASNKAHEESDFIAALLGDQLDIDAFSLATSQLAVDYLSTPAEPIMNRAQRLRRSVLESLKLQTGNEHSAAPDEDLVLATGQLSGILAYAALDTGDAVGAKAHARAALACAERIDHNELRAWVRGTQSLIARFDGNYDLALALARSGMSYATSGTSLARLRCGEAQSLANLGDAKGAGQALDAAQDAREKIARPDSLTGLFTFTEAKQHYYAGSALIWVPTPGNARRAVQEAQHAIDMWQVEPPETRSLDDEALAHIYMATAFGQLGDVEGLMGTLRPILELPPERRISWIVKRLDRITDLLRSDRYAKSNMAREALSEIEAYQAA